jgi:hypothetical protein
MCIRKLTDRDTVAAGSRVEPLGNGTVEKEVNLILLGAEQSALSPSLLPLAPIISEEFFRLVSPGNLSYL